MNKLAVRLAFHPLWEKDWRGAGLELQKVLTEFEGKPSDTLVASLEVFFHLDPRRWGFGYSKDYYDGPISTFTLGPLVFCNFHWFE